MRRNPGDVVFQAKNATVIYSPSQGSSVKYRIVCKHGAGVNERGYGHARWAARHPDDFCAECAAEAKR